MCYAVGWRKDMTAKAESLLDKALALIPELHRFLMQKPGETALDDRKK